MSEDPTLKEGWWMPYRATSYHYFVEGRALCNGWMFPNYCEMSGDTGNKEPQKDDCRECFNKLLKRREKAKRII